MSDLDIFDTCLLQSINKARGNHDIEIIPIINNDNRYSASLALNIGIRAAKSNLIICAHQDVVILHNWFDILESVLLHTPDPWGIIGSAGISLQYNRSHIGAWGGSLSDDIIAVGSVWDTLDSNLEPYWNGVRDLTRVHCVDECLLVLNKRTGLQFDPAFTGFHFYGADICLQARAANYPVYCVYLPIVHYGKYSGSFSSDTHYWYYLRKLHAKWKYRFPELLGTHMHWADGELTSYIPIGLESDDGIGVKIRSMGIKELTLNDESDNFVSSSVR